MNYSKIKLISDEAKEEDDVIEVRESDLVTFSRRQTINGDCGHALVDVRGDGILKNKGLFICSCSFCGEPKIVIDDCGEICLIFVKKG